MSLIKLDFSGVYEPELLSGDSEAQLQIIGMKEHTSDAGNESLHIIFDCPEKPKVEDIHLYLGLPKDGDDDKVKNKKLLKFQKFCTCFGLDNDVDTESGIGATGWCIVSEKEDSQYGKKNEVKTFITGA